MKMNKLSILAFALLFLIGHSYAGLVHRPLRHAHGAPLDQIPVVVVHESEPFVRSLIKDAAPEAPVKEEVPPPAKDSGAQADVLKAATVTAEVAEGIAQAVEQGQQLRTDSALIEAEKNIIEEAKETTIAEEYTKPLAPSADLVLVASSEPVKAIESIPLKEVESAPTPSINTDTLSEETLKADQAPLQPAADLGDIKEETLDKEQTSNQLKGLPSNADADANPNPSVDAVKVQPLEGETISDAIEPASKPDEVSVHERQATPATPTQSTTQQNLVQQIIQNSPLGQFISQFTGGQQQQQQQQQQQSDEQPATPAPTLPGFLNPITQAQQVFQNIQQQLQNSTSQAIQGVQQFASNLGTQFQNTFSNLVGQQNQLTTADSTTTRPPGPFQAIVNNIVGNNQNAAEGSSTAAPAQQQGPLQGILNLFQGNRPQSTTAAPAASQPAKETATSKPSGVDDKLEVHANDEVAVAEEVSQDLAAEQIDEQTDEKPEEKPIIETDENNEVRNSEETDASFEETRPDELIVVNDDPSQDVVV